MPPSGKFSVYITGNTSVGNVIQGNYIGTDHTGTVALSSGTNGILINDAPNTQIGGSSAEAANVVAGYSLAGIFVQQDESAGSAIQGNFIGTDTTGTLDLSSGNTYGVVVQSLASNIQIGGTEDGAGNTIAYNGLMGIRLVSTAGTGIRINQNRIYANASSLGIDLLGNGVTLQRPR